jgi:hypothetical protein
MRTFQSARADGTYVFGIIDDSKGGDGQRVELFEIAMGGASATVESPLVLGRALVQDVQALSYAASVELSLLDSPLQKVDLAGNITFTLTDHAAGRGLSLKVLADGSTRNLTFPAGWKFLGERPATLAASKTGILSILCWGNADADVVAAFSAET